MLTRMRCIGRKEGVPASFVGLQNVMSKDRIHRTESVVALRNNPQNPIGYLPLGCALTKCVAVGVSYSQSYSDDGFNLCLWSICSVLPCPVRGIFNKTQSQPGRSQPGTRPIGFTIKFGLLGLPIFHPSFHFVLASNFPEINFWASLPIGF